MRKATVESLEKKLAAARAFERSIADQMVKAKKAAVRDERSRQKDAARRRGELLESEREALFVAHPDVAAKVLGWFDQVLTDPLDRALLGLPISGSSPMV